jgi:hypothetical protein
MAQTFKHARVAALQQGVQLLTCTVDVPSGADQSVAIVFPRAFAAAPRVLGAPVRVDANALDVAAVASITGLTTTGCTIRLKGTTTVQWTFDVTFVGDYNNATAY